MSREQRAYYARRSQALCDSAMTPWEILWTTKPEMALCYCLILYW